MPSIKVTPPEIHYACLCVNNNIVICSKKSEEDDINYGKMITDFLINQDIIYLELDTVTVPYQNYQIHFYMESGALFTCVTQGLATSKVPQLFLQALSGRYLETMASNREHLIEEGCVYTMFSQALADTMKQFNQRLGGKLIELNAYLEELKKTMLENIDKIIDRGERMEDLIQKSEHLEASINGFKPVSKIIYREMMLRKQLYFTLSVISVVGVLCVVMGALMAAGVIM